jgi:hypothetical protein
MLWAEYRRMEAASRAAARFESDVHEAFVAERIAEGYDEGDAGKIGRVFDASDFVASFRKFLRLRIDRRMVKLLNMDDYEESIMAERIKETLASPSTQAKPMMKQIQIGDAEIQQAQQLKAMAARQRRGK